MSVSDSPRIAWPPGGYDRLTMSKWIPAPAVLCGLALAAALPAAPALAAAPPAKQIRPQQSGLGFRGARRAPSLGTRFRGRTRPSSRRVRPVRPFRGFFRGFLQALGLAYLFHLLFGWGAGGSPFGLLLLAALILFAVTRRRRRVTYY
jgi:hypothetical protein